MVLIALRICWALLAFEEVFILSTGASRLSFYVQLGTLTRLCKGVFPHAAVCAEVRILEVRDP